MCRSDHLTSGSFERIDKQVYKPASCRGSPAVLFNYYLMQVVSTSAGSIASEAVFGRFLEHFLPMYSLWTYCQAAGFLFGYLVLHTKLLDPNPQHLHFMGQNLAMALVD